MQLHTQQQRQVELIVWKAGIAEYVSEPNRRKVPVLAFRPHFSSPTPIRSDADAAAHQVIRPQMWQQQQRQQKHRNGETERSGGAARGSERTKATDWRRGLRAADLVGPLPTSSRTSPRPPTTARTEATAGGATTGRWSSSPHSHEMPDIACWSGQSVGGTRLTHS
eukprot:GHVU01140598.1.p2 GENE.GHVU01140598.1~~GHVU01140598.1.p2  ORF type:complete len:166 (-),score=23.66 GHVU01140598.1:401-898(-)